MGCFPPASAPDIFFIFLVPSFSLPFVLFFLLSIIYLFFQSFRFLVWNCSLPPLKNNGNEDVEEMAVSSFCYHIGFIHCIFFSFFSTFSVVCAYIWLIFIGCLVENKMMALSLRDRGRRETSQRSKACGKFSDLPVLTGKFWTLDAALLFPASSKRKTDVASLFSSI